MRRKRIVLKNIILFGIRIAEKLEVMKVQAIEVCTKSEVSSKT